MHKHKPGKTTAGQLAMMQSSFFLVLQSNSCRLLATRRNLLSTDKPGFRLLTASTFSTLPNIDLSSTTVVGKKSEQSFWLSVSPTSLKMQNLAQVFYSYEVFHIVKLCYRSHGQFRPPNSRFTHPSGLSFKDGRMGSWLGKTRWANLENYMDESCKSCNFSTI